MVHGGDTHEEPSAGRTRDELRFSGPSEMHRRVSELDWSKTPVGPVETWPLSLESTVRTLLSSRYPMVLTWGPKFTQFYNDAYSELIGDRHPAALGGDIRDTLAESWETLGPMIDKVMRTGVANWTAALPLTMQRAGYQEEAYFSVSHAPAEDDDGNIAGMLAVCSEVTQQVLSERRTRLLRELALKAGASTQSVETTCRDIGKVLSGHSLDLPFALIYLMSDDARSLELRSAVGVEPGKPASPRQVDLRSADSIWPFARAVGNETVEVDDVDDYLSLRGGFFDEPVRSALVMPLSSPDPSVPAGVLVAGVSPNRGLDEAYSSFYDLLSSQVSIALRNAAAYENQRERAEELAKLDRAKTAFFSNVSHEFRTPLTLMLGPAEDALGDEDEPLSPKNRERLETIYRNAKRQLKLVNTLLDFARLESGRAYARFRATDLAALTRQLASSFGSAFHSSGLELHVDVHAGEPVFVDPRMWEKIVLNLMSNALKFTHEGRVEVRLRHTEDAVELQVEDTGVGISPKELPHIFERFRQAEGTRSRSHEGSGIGLSLVHELVELHGGSIEVDSEVDQGTTFTLTIPMGTAHLPDEQVVEDDKAVASVNTDVSSYVEEALSWLDDDTFDQSDAFEQSAETRSAESKPVELARDDSKAPEAQQAHILVADDNADMRAYLKRLLGARWRVRVVADGKAALESARRQPPDLVISDIMMPLMDGIELLQALRQDVNTKAIPVILLSARAGEDSLAEGLATGADDYLLKPFSARELMVRVESRLELSRMRQKLNEQRHAIAAKDEFLSIASHELRTPLAAMELPIHTVRHAARAGDHLPSEWAVEMLDKALEQTGRMTRLIDRLMDIADLADGARGIEFEEVDLSQVVSEEIERLRSRPRAPVVRAEVAQDVTGYWNRDYLEKIVSNLLDNAVKFGEGEPVEVELRASSTEATLEVTDHGRGIATEDLDRLFERFERGVSARQISGFGLGLSVVRQAVDAMDGKLDIDSTSGVGSVFTVVLSRGAGRDD